MTTLHLTAPADAQGELAELYANIQQAFGGVPEGLQLFGVSPKLLQIQMQLLGYFGQHPRLSPNFLALLRYILSEDGHCQFCIGFNRGLLLNAGISDSAIANALKDPRHGPLSDAENQLLDYAVRAVRNPRAVEDQEITALHQLGWTDQDIFDAVAHGAQHTAVDILFETFRVAAQ
ncbi:carboxymuconolactone decarboxylase family protein [Acidithiobacillus sp. IBUN Pt1247-S3]|uniref:carboxymuconolactone decarboxylase family protein n=1 Tax=Acidithiobacillus sp. IBUN Pt1247-S3 TaxID=3166642 RepID=UPI0034E3C8DD